MAYVVMTARAGEAPSSNMATPVVNNVHFLLAFDAATDESIRFSNKIPSDYDADDITVEISWIAASATSGAVKWNVAFERLTTGLGSDGFAAVQTVTTTKTGSADDIVKSSITFTQAQADAVIAEDNFRIEITRDANDAADTMTGDAQLLSVSVAY